MQSTRNFANGAAGNTLCYLIEVLNVTSKNLIQVLTLNNSAFKKCLNVRFQEIHKNSLSKLAAHLFCSHIRLGGCRGITFRGTIFRTKQTTSHFLNRHKSSCSGGFKECSSPLYGSSHYNRAICKERLVGSRIVVCSFAPRATRGVCSQAP